ncbi:hypothetical protein [Streptomyces sp. NPDC007264]|uniref:hypothetical protein n=1 Tax=Streptomyces sp. NPDC007264 TaxID=3364777 RepID=UPI0036DE0ACF
MDHQHSSAPARALITPTEPADLDVAIRVAQRMLATYGQPAYSDAGAVAQAHGALTESLRILLRSLGAEAVDAR